MLKPAAEVYSEDRLYNREFITIWVGNVCFVLANTMIAHYARWIDFLGGDVNQTGRIMGLGAIASLVMRPWMGQWINRFGPRFVWGTGLLVFAVGIVGNFVLTDLNAAIYFLRGLLAVGAAFVFASSLAYISQSAPPSRRTEAIGILGAAGFAGMIIGPYLADWILAGEVRERAQFYRLFSIALVALLFPAISLLVIPKVRRTPGSPQDGVRLSDFIRTSTAYWPGATSAVVLAFGLCMTIPFIFLASFVDTIAPNTSFRAVGVFFLGYAGWGIILRVATSHLVDRIGRGKVLFTGTLFMAAQMFAFLAVSPDNLWTLLIPALLGGTGHALMFHTMMSLMLESFPPHLRGTGSALSLMTLDAGMICGAPILGWIAKNHGYMPVFITIGCSCLIAAAVYGMTLRRDQIAALAAGTPPADVSIEREDLLNSLNCGTGQKISAGK
ncbi:MAG TPA: MFS transporter [Planctomycetaceae bacterium]|nr:MFS transporter [Planctomycetaceae bacterium]